MSDMFETLFGSQDAGAIAAGSSILKGVPQRKSWLKKAILLRSPLLREARQLAKIKFVIRRTKKQETDFLGESDFPFFNELQLLFVRPGSSVYDSMFKEIAGGWRCACF